MYTTGHIDPARPANATRFLNMRVLCGQCGFKCCNSPSLAVECTPQEAADLNLPILFQQEGHCRCLGAAGCVHGARRPVFCKLFPLQVDKNNNLIVSHWAILNCPTAADYVLREQRGGKYYYTRKPGINRAKENNSHAELVLDAPLDTWPNALELCGEAVEEFYTSNGLDRIRRRLALLNGAGGFGLS